MVNSAETLELASGSHSKHSLFLIYKWENFHCSRCTNQKTTFPFPDMNKKTFPFPEMNQKTFTFPDIWIRKLLLFWMYELGKRAEEGRLSRNPWLPASSCLSKLPQISPLFFPTFIDSLEDAPCALQSSSFEVFWRIANIILTTSGPSGSQKVLTKCGWLSRNTWL